MRKVWKRLLSFAVGVSLTAAASAVVLSQSLRCFGGKEL